jgi:hypothetical protein
LEPPRSLRTRRPHGPPSSKSSKRRNPPGIPQNLDVSRLRSHAARLHRRRPRDRSRPWPLPTQPSPPRRERVLLQWWHEGRGSRSTLR